MQEMLKTMYDYLAAYGLNLIAALLIFFVGKWAAKVITNLIEKLLNTAKMDHTLSAFLKHITYVGTLVFVIIAALSKLGVQTTSLVAAVGAAGLAVGLALQGSLANFAAGVMLILFQPFKVGDFIEAAGAKGTVREIQIFNTIINMPDNRLVVLPNSKITGDNIINYSNIENRRIDLVFGISYDDDMRKAKEALEGVIKADSRVLADPAPRIAVSELGDSSVNLVCRPWVKPGDYWDVYFETLEKGKLALEAAGITIPFPQRDVHLYKEGNE